MKGSEKVPKKKDKSKVVDPQVSVNIELESVKVLEDSIDIELSAKTSKEDYFSRFVFPKVMNVPVMYLSDYNKQSAKDRDGTPLIVVADVRSQEDVLKDIANGQMRLEVDATVCNPIGTYEQTRLEYTGLELAKAISKPIPIDNSMCARLVAVNRNYVEQPRRRRARLYMRFTFDVERCALAHKNKQKNDERFRG